MIHIESQMQIESVPQIAYHLFLSRCEQIRLVWAAYAAHWFASRTTHAPRAPTQHQRQINASAGVVSQLNRWPRARARNAAERLPVAPPRREWLTATTRFVLAAPVLPVNSSINRAALNDTRPKTAWFAPNLPQ